MSRIAARLAQLEKARPKVSRPFAVSLIGPDDPLPAPVPGVPECVVTVIRLVPPQTKEKTHAEH